MHERWPLFRTVVSNMAMVLAKTDLAIAARYQTLAADARAPTLRHRRGRARRAVLDGAGRSPVTTTCSYDNPALARGVRYRIPYIDPLNHMQVELLRRWRGGDRRRAHPTRHPPRDQRRRHRPAQQRLTVGRDRYAPSTQSCIDPSNGQSPLVYRAAIVEMPDQAPRTTSSG